MLAASEDTLRRRLTAHANGQFVAVATNGSLLGAIYTQRVASYATLLTAQRETELELHVPAGSVIQLLGIVQRADARVGDQLRSYVLLHARRDATVERVCGVTRCRAYKPSSGVDYQAHVKEASDPSLLFHTGAGATRAGRGAAPARAALSVSSSVSSRRARRGARVVASAADEDERAPAQADAGGWFSFGR